MLDIALRRQQGSFLVDVAFRAEGASVTALFGRSGSGKTSIIEMVAGLSHPDAGRVQVGDRVLFDRAAGIDLPPHRRRIGYVFQESRLFPHYSVAGNLRYGMERVPVAERFVAFDQVVELLGIAPLLDRRPARLSGGERQRVAIGRALLSSPRLLLMDEPLASLDGARKNELLPFIALLPQQFGLPILYVSHAVDEVLRLADQLVLLDNGRVLAAGPLETVMGRRDFSLVAGGSDLATVIVAQVAAHDEALAATRLEFSGAVLTVPRLAESLGSWVRVRIDAGNVILALEEPRGLSVRNIFKGRVVAIRRDLPLVDVALDIGCPLHAEITPQALAELRLEPGMEVYALVKSASITHGDIAGHAPQRKD